MDRRSFAKALSTAAFGNLVRPANYCGDESTRPVEHALPEVRYKTSVMLWPILEALPFEVRLEKIAEAGFKSVELVGEEYEHWTESDFRKANQKRRELGVSFDTTAIITHGVGDPRARDAFLSDLENTLTIANKIDCPSIIVMMGNQAPNLAPEAQQASAVEGLKRAAEILEGTAVTLLLENLYLKEQPNYYSVPKGIGIVKDVGHPQVKYLLDFFHAQRSEGNLIENLEKGIDYLGLVHIGDVPGRHEPGTGEINFPNIYKKLRQLEYSKYVAMEFYPTGDPVLTLQRAREEALQLH